MNTFVELQKRELESSIEKHGHFNSAHEAYAVLLEEVEEFWEEVRKKKKTDILI